MSAEWRESAILSPSERRQILDLCLTWEDRLGRESIDEGRRRRVQHNSPGGHWLLRDGENVVGYAGILFHHGVEVEVLGGSYDPELAALVRADRKDVYWWLRDGSQIPAGVTVTRRLNFMEAPLRDLSVSPDQPGLRQFDLSRDIDRWIEHNNAAFAAHPDQGSWTKADFQIRVDEPWFDPSAFLIWDDEENIAASCWIKFHELAAQRVGEIYVFSVDPSQQGRGWGRRMLDAGLEAISRRGVQKAVLYVDDDNSAATRLYESGGFVTHRQDLLLRVS
jgi:mycothiol synthase